jgi:hypothetical protein
MPQSSTGPECRRYIIRAAGDSAPLLAFIASIRADPEVTLVDTVGPPQQPHTAIAEMSEATASMLRQRFCSSNQLMIEPDRPLSLF